MEPRFAGRIFREFFRIDDSLSASRSGTGLGLSIARDIARRHGGDVLYAPRPGGGSLFSLRLPQVGGTHEIPPPGAKGPQALWNPNKRGKIE